MSYPYLANNVAYALPQVPAKSHLKGAVSLEVPSVLPVPTKDEYPVSLSQSRKTALAVLLVLANFVPMITFGAGMGGGLHISASLGVNEPSQASWIAASYPLTAGAFILMSGRLGAVFGHARILLLGAFWWTVWTLINGFCTDFTVFNVIRGLSGIGGAMVVPNAVAVIGTTFPPGTMRNRCLGLFGAGAPVGGWFGVLMAGFLAERLPFKWLFVFM